MLAHLARHGCRRALGCCALTPACSRRAPRQALLVRLGHCCQCPTAKCQRRTFFEFLRKPKREIRIPRFDPGYAALLKFRRNQVDNLRLPPDEVVIRGIREMVQYKLSRGLPVNKLQATCIEAALKHLLEQEQGRHVRLLDFQDLIDLQRAFLLSPPGDVSNHATVSTQLHHAILERFDRSDSADPEQDGMAEFAPTDKDKRAEMVRFLTALSYYNQSENAWKALKRHVEALEQKQAKLHRLDSHMWKVVMRGMAQEGKEEGLLEVAENYEKVGFLYSQAVQAMMVRFYAHKGERQNIQKWLDRPLEQGSRKWGQLSAAALREVMSFVARSEDQETQQWGDDLLHRVCDSNPHKRLWDVILEWGVVIKNKSLEDIEQMGKVMKGFGIEPDILTVNGLVAAAAEKGDSYLAERFASSLPVMFNATPNATTFILQMEYRLKAGDLKGVRAPYESLLEILDQGEPEDAEGRESEQQIKTSLQPQFMDEFGLPEKNRYVQALPAVNKYMRALCEARTEENTRMVMTIGQEVEERALILEPVTVVSLCMMFFARDSSFDVIDVLCLYAGQYSAQERHVVSHAFVDYICNRQHSTARAWDAYQLMRQFFPEMPKDFRLRIMDEFFKRKRGDMAAIVFANMRELSNENDRPTSDDYVAVFEGLSRWPDEEALNLTYNMLKLDVLISYNTRLYNALMMAFGATERPRKAEIFWQEIQNSIEGPSYKSLEIVFWVFGNQGPGMGDARARSLWEKLRRMDIAIPENVWMSYVAALASCECVDEVIKIVEDGCEGVEEIMDETSVFLPPPFFFFFFFFFPTCPCN